MTLALYLGRLFAVRFAAALMALAGLLQLVDLLDSADEILDRGRGTAGLLMHAVLRLPLMLPPAIPIAALTAGLFTFMTLAWRSEIAAMKAAGVGVGRIVALLLPAGVAAGALLFAVADRWAPVADSAYARWWESAPAEPLWFRLGTDIVQAVVAADGETLGRVELYRRGPDATLVEMVTARTAVRRDGGWVLRDGTARIPGGHPAAFAERAWAVSLEPANLLELTRRDPILGTGQIRAILADQRVGRDSPGSYRFRLVRAFTQPLVPVVMLLLATPVAGGQRRSGGIAAGMAVGLAAGLSYLVLDGILAALGETGTLPPLLAAWAAHAVFAGIGGALLLRAEG